MTRGGGGVTPIYWLYVPLEKGMVFKPFILGKGLVIIENWSRTGSHIMESLSRQKIIVIYNKMLKSRTIECFYSGIGSQNLQNLLR